MLKLNANQSIKNPSCWIYISKDKHKLSNLLLISKFPVLSDTPKSLVALHLYMPASLILRPVITKSPFGNCLNFSLIEILLAPKYHSICGAGAASGRHCIVILPLTAPYIWIGNGFLLKDGLKAEKLE